MCEAKSKNRQSERIRRREGYCHLFIGDIDVAASKETVQAGQQKL
jgi:hypothetical protein